jgi:hypothetical protein
MKFPPATLLPALLLAAAAQAAERPIEMTIPPGKTEEICLPVKVGETLHWRFTADVPVDFNLHHHVGKKLVMPVKLKRSTGHEGQHAAEVANTWCLMWTAPKKSQAWVQGGFATDDIVR